MVSQDLCLIKAFVATCHLGPLSNKSICRFRSFRTSIKLKSLTLQVIQDFSPIKAIFAFCHSAPLSNKSVCRKFCLIYFKFGQNVVFRYPMLTIKKEIKNKKGNINIFSHFLYKWLQPFSNFCRIHRM